jgi:hypothetical protein
VRLLVLRDSCRDVILGLDFLGQHRLEEIPMGGNGPPLSICGMTAIPVPCPSLFAHTSPDCRPIATKSRRHSSCDAEFIRSEVKRLLSEGIIEPSRSPWRAQVLVVSSAGRKKRMVVDYSSTINRFTQLDAYPLPLIRELVEKIAKHRVFSTIDLKSAYHQIPIPEEDMHYTAFEADGGLWQFRRIPFGVTNGVACFQRVIDRIIEEEGLTGTFAYLDDVTICGNDQNEHDENLQKFLDTAKRYSLILNNDKKCFLSLYN